MPPSPAGPRPDRLVYLPGARRIALLQKVGLMTSLFERVQNIRVLWQSDEVVEHLLARHLRGRAAELFVRVEGFCNERCAGVRPVRHLLGALARGAVPTGTGG